MVGCIPQFKTALGLTVSSRMPGSKKELKAKEGRTVRTRLSLCAFWNPFTDLGREKSHDTMLKHQNHFWNPSETGCPSFSTSIAHILWELCRLSRSLVFVGSWPSAYHPLYSIITAEGESGECIPCISGAERGHLTLNSPLMVTASNMTCLPLRAVLGSSKWLLHAFPSSWPLAR
jgi:hypothetical protein